MSEVKRYWPEEIVGTGELVVYAQDYAALDAECDALLQQCNNLARLLCAARELIDHGDFSEGHCMCGSSVDRHEFGDGHSPVDAGEYYAGQLCESIDTALASSHLRINEGE